MAYLHSARALLLMSILLSSCASLTPPPRNEVVTYIDLERPTVVAFLPLSLRPTDVDATTLRGRLAEELDRARTCLGNDYGLYRLVYADRIIVHAHEQEESFAIDNAIPLLGALLLRPDANPRIVFAGDPDGLRRMLRRALPDYFERTCNG